MNITEEQKQEADRIVEKYKNNYILDHNIIGGGKPNRIQSAIQDRQSVLDLAIKAFNRTNSSKGFNHFFDDEIQSLINQIEYLKSKI